MSAATVRGPSFRVPAFFAHLIGPSLFTAANAKKQAKLLAEGQFIRTIGSFARAIHGDIVNLTHASVILVHYERFGGTFDLWAKLLVQDMREEAIYGANAELVSRILIASLENVCWFHFSLLMGFPDVGCFTGSGSTSRRHRQVGGATSCPRSITQRRAHSSWCSAVHCQAPRVRVSRSDPPRLCGVCREEDCSFRGEQEEGQA